MNECSRTVAWRNDHAGLGRPYHHSTAVGSEQTGHSPSPTSVSDFHLCSMEGKELKKA